MTNYDLRTRKALRQVTLLEFGFGPETMRRLCRRNSYSEVAASSPMNSELSTKTSE